MHACVHMECTESDPLHLHIAISQFAQLHKREKDNKAAFNEAKTYKDLYLEAESKRSIADGQVNELMALVNAMEEEVLAYGREGIEALREENLKLIKHYDVSFIIGL